MAKETERRRREAEEAARDEVAGASQATEEAEWQAKMMSDIKVVREHTRGYSDSQVRATTGLHHALDA